MEITGKLAKQGILEEQPAAGRFETAGVVTVCSAHAVHDAYQSFLPTLLPILIDRFSISTAEAGVFSFVNSGLSLFQPLSGNLADRINLRWLVYLGPLLAGVVMSLFGVAPVYSVAVLLSVAAGLNSAAFHSVAPVLVANYSGRRLGRGMSFWMVGGELGRTLGPLLVVTWIGLAGVPALPWLSLLGAAVAGVLFIRLRDAPHRAPGVGERHPLGQALRHLRPMLVPMGLIMGLRAMLESSLATYVPTLITRDGSSLWLAGASFAVMEAAGMVGALTGGSLSDRLGRRKVLAGVMVLGPLSLLLFLAADGWAELLTLVLVGLFAMACNPVVMAVFQESLPENRALANGLYQGIHLVMRALATLVVGGLGDLFGLRYAFAVGAWTALAAVPVVLLLPQRHKPGG